MRFQKSFRHKQFIIFDLDGTLTESKSPLAVGMNALLVRLLEHKRVAIIGGGRYEQFQKQFVRYFRAPAWLTERLFLFPTNSTAFYRYQGRAFRNVYEHIIPKAERERIMKVVAAAARDMKYPVLPKPYGPTIEDRKTQISFSPLGQNVGDALGAKRGVVEKEKWNKEYDHLRQRLARVLRTKLPKYSVLTGGLTTIDITQKGIDKGYGVRHIAKIFKVPIKDMLFIGDAMYKGGNDAAAKKTGIDWVQVDGPEDTKRLIRAILS